MIVVLLGKAGAGKTTIAKRMVGYLANSALVDGDELRAETGNKDLSINGREANMHLGLSRARELSDKGFTVFVAMQAPIKAIREQYLCDDDIQVMVINEGDNPKDKLGYNADFKPEYPAAIDVVFLHKCTPSRFYERFLKDKLKDKELK